MIDTMAISQPIWDFLIVSKMSGTSKYSNAKISNKLE
jgi:hypothetical protein